MSTRTILLGVTSFLVAMVLGCDEGLLITAGGPTPTPAASDDQSTAGVTSNGTGTSAATALQINIQVDAELEDTAGLTRIVDEFKRRSARTTIYVSADYANRNATRITELYRDGFEIALHGYNTGEQLHTMTYADQLDLLTRAKAALEGCRPCGTYKPIIGFRPQYFSQNEDTYLVLDELGITYNSGFKAGLLFMEGHEADTAPYSVEGHNFTAVPISTVEYAGQRLYLCDIGSAQGEGITGEQWSEMLQLGWQQAVERQTPLVVLVHGWYTGDTDQYDYWQPFVDLLDAVATEGRLVTTAELVEASAPTE
jgi:peptidoglycan/xylan/chitin deacetylase (PgdA/CDA1 family)